MTFVFSGLALGRVILLLLFLTTQIVGDEKRVQPTRVRLCEDSGAARPLGARRPYDGGGGAAVRHHQVRRLPAFLPHLPVRLP